MPARMTGSCVSFQRCYGAVWGVDCPGDRPMVQCSVSASAAGLRGAAMDRGSDMPEMLRQMMEIACRAGEVARGHAGRLAREDVYHKSSVDMVTRLDRELEAMIRDGLAEAFPEVAFYGEEGEYGRLEDFERVFIVDPLDGTTSFIHGHPFYSISLAYREGEESRLGVVHLPAFRETYWAERGKGAYHDGNRIHVSRTDRLLESLVATGFACVRERVQPDNIPLFCDTIYRVRGVRRCGSAAADLCYVADGRYDLFWELRLSPWDIAAGTLIVQEAGGLVTDLDGGNRYEAKRHLVASNGRVHEEFLALAAAHPHGSG